MRHTHTSTSWERQGCSLLGLKNRTLASNVYFSVKTGWDENKMTGRLACTHTHTANTHTCCRYIQTQTLNCVRTQQGSIHSQEYTLTYTHTSTTSLWLPQRPLSHVEQIHTSTVMSVCSSQPHTADLFIRNSAAQGHPAHSLAFLFSFFFCSIQISHGQFTPIFFLHKLIRRPTPLIGWNAAASVSVFATILLVAFFSEHIWITAHATICI